MDLASAAGPGPAADIGALFGTRDLNRVNWGARISPSQSGGKPLTL